MRISFEVTRGPHAGLAVDVDGQQTLLAGRSRKAQLRLDKELLSSRFQFRVAVSPTQCYLLDLGSNNGTFVNGEKTTGTFVDDGDVISVGRTEIRVRVAKAAAGQSDGAPAVPRLSPAKSLPGQSLTGKSSRADVGGGTDGDALPIRLDGYRILKEIGRGPRGGVYHARHRETRTDVALKLIRPTHSVLRERVKQFLRKAGKLSELDHSGIISYLEMGKKSRFLYVITEYVPTVPIENAMRNVSVSSRICICCGICCQVLETLKYAHAKSLVHRDIKPANVLLFQRRKKLNVKLADFGLARIIGDVGLADITADGDIRGSSAYMAPELIVNSRFAKPSCDLYSLGATLYYFLTGQHPFGKARGGALVRSILNDPPIPMRSICPEIPQALADVIERALAKEPARRWLSADEMSNALFLFSKPSFVKRITN